MPIQLLPCPYCGSTRTQTFQSYFDGETRWVCWCPDCQCNGPMSRSGFESARQLWNRRFSPINGHRHQIASLGTYITTDHSAAMDEILRAHGFGERLEKPDED